MACYYGLKIIKDPGLPVSKRVRLLSVRMKNQDGRHGLLFQTCRTSEPDFGFSPDAEFQSSMGEKETSLSTFIFGMTHGTAHLHSFTGGLREKHGTRVSDCSRFWTTTRSCWPLRCLCQGTPSSSMKSQLLTKKPIPLPLLGNLLMDQLLKMGLMVRPTWLSC